MTQVLYAIGITAAGLLGIIILSIAAATSVLVALHCFGLRRTRKDDENAYALHEIAAELQAHHLYLYSAVQTVTALAWFCQQNGIVRRRDGKGDYVLAAKEKHA